MRKLAVIIVVGALCVLPRLTTAGTIGGTAHDLSGAAWNGDQSVCKLCHVPHFAGATRLIWNHTLSANAFTWDRTTTWAGTGLPANIANWDGTTKECLSCHDGSVAEGDLYHGGYAGSPKVGPSAQISTPAGSLAKNHPVSVPYPYNNAANTYNGQTNGSDYDVTAAYVADPTLGGKIRLYKENPAGIVSIGKLAGKTGIECGSCHNPHDNTNDPFLRDSYAQSTICEDCHTY